MIPLGLVLVIVSPLLYGLLIQRRTLRQMFDTPSHLLRNLVSSRLRRNHAIEHATINVLAERFGMRGISGMPTLDGFRIRAIVDPIILLEAAHEGLRRLQRGEMRLALNRDCVSSFVTVQMLVGMFCVMLLGSAGMTLIALIPLTVLLMLGTAPVLSLQLQRVLLSSVNVQGITIDGLMPGIAPLHHELAVRTRPARRRTYEPPYRYGEPVRAYVPVRDR